VALVGRFSAYTDGSVRVVFDDRTCLDMHGLHWEPHVYNRLLSQNVVSSSSSCCCCYCCSNEIKHREGEYRLGRKGEGKGGGWKERKIGEGALKQGGFSPKVGGT